MLRIKVRPLFFLLMARNTHAAPLGVFPASLTLTSTLPATQPAVDIMAEWIRHVSHVPNLLPAELLILFCLIFAFLFKVTCMIYRARKAETARTRLVLEIGNGSDSVLLPALELPYLSKFYRLHLNRMELGLRLFEFRFGAQLAWTNGVSLTNTALDITIPLPDRIKVPFWKINKLKL